MNITLFALSGALIALSSGVMAFGMFFAGRSRLQTLWGIFCLVVFVWGVGVFFIGSTTNPHIAELWWRAVHVDVAFMPVVFLHFVYVFLQRKVNTRLLVFYAMATAISALAVFTPLLINHMRFTFGQFYYDSPPGGWYWIYMAFFLCLTVYNHIVLYLRLREGTVDALERQRIQYFFLASAIGFTGASVCFLPVYGIDIYPISNFTVVVYPLMMGYAIFRFKLFDIRAVAAQGLVLLLWIFVGVRFILSTSHEDFVLNAFLLAAVVILGFYFVASLKKELAQREEIERLSQEKSEFMTFASHEIRNPITAMRGYASLILDGTTGEVSPKTRETAQTILVQGNEVLTLIAQYLSKSKMELGQISYAHDPFDMGAIVLSIANGYKPHAEQKGLTLETRVDPAQKYTVVGDEGKVKEVIGNIVDNSLKYTKSGGITISVERHGVSIRAVVSDTGVGIDPKVLPELFKKFSRADAQKVNLLGTGIGLYLAKTFIEAQGAHIWAESDGKDKGSRFIIEFPAA